MSEPVWQEVEAPSVYWLFLSREKLTPEVSSESTPHLPTQLPLPSELGKFFPPDPLTSPSQPLLHLPEGSN